MADKRFSILVDDLDYCIVCGKPHPHKHEVFFGSKRKLSIKYGMVLPLCYLHHEGDESQHKDREIDLQYKKKAQAIWESTYGTREDFIRIFGKSYL